MVCNKRAARSNNSSSRACHLAAARSNVHDRTVSPAVVRKGKAWTTTYTVFNGYQVHPAQN